MAADCSECDGYDYNDTDWGKQIRCLKCEVESLKDEINKLSSNAKNFSSKLGESNNIMKNMLSTINDMRKRMYEFTRSTSQQYELAEKIAKSYKEAALQIGLSVNRSKGFSESFKSSVAEIAKFGGTIEEAQAIYQDFSENSGRVRILGEDEVTNIFKLGKAANLYGNEATSLYETLDLMGVSNLDATKRMTDLIKESQSIGLNSSKVVKTLSTNIERMQTYSFANGVKGMTEMSKLAVKMRMDVSDMLGMAEKFYEPEAAIEAAANLQMLGGDIANAFGDPFETMYLARNKPEELAKKVGSMVENMMQLNEKTGEYEFPAEARMQLKAAGEQLGINVDKMIEMTRQSAKIKDVKNQLSMKGMFSEDELEGIASMARLEGGEFKVDVYDEDGKKMTKSLDQLQKEDLKMLMIPPDDEKDYQSKMIHQSMTTNEHLKNIEDTFQKTFIKGIDVYQINEDASKKTIDATRELTLDSVNALVDKAKKSFIGEIGGLGKESLVKIDETMAKYIESMTDFISGDADLDIDVENGVINVLGSTEGYNPAANKSTGSAGATTASAEEIKKQYCIDQNGTLGVDGICRASNGTIIPLPLAKGGIVTKPVNALIGEAGEPEAVFPLSKLENFIQSQQMGGKVTLEGNPTITLNINSNNPNLTFSEDEKNKIKDNILSVVTKMFNNGGSPDGSNLPQGSKGYIQTI